MNKIELFQTDKVWDQIRDRVWEMTNEAHQEGRAQNSRIVKSLESRLATQYGRQYCVTTASGTDALILAIKCLQLPPQSRIAVGTYTFIATAHAIARAGHIPMPVDINHNYCIDWHKIPPCDAVVGIDIFGNSCDWNAIRYLGVPVICDAAQSLESVDREGFSSLQHGFIACTSFAPSKPISSFGSGGALLTNDPTVDEFAREYRLHGKTHSEQACRDPGLNSMISSFEAACVHAGIEHSQAWQDRRIKITEYLLDRSHYMSPLDRNLKRHSYSKLVFRSTERDRTIEKLHMAGIATAIHYPRLIHQEPLYQQLDQCPVADAASQMTFTVPNQHTLTDSEVERIAEALQ